ncbi:hypothetical protein BDV27DRAFT_119656, partial [Aspergillus caelatus]
MHLVKSLALLVLPSAMAMSGPILGFGFRDDECHNPVGPIESGECFRTEYIESYALHVGSLCSFYYRSDKCDGPHSTVPQQPGCYPANLPGKPFSIKCRPLD